MKHKGMVDKTVSTQITWKQNCDPTMQKKKKKRGGKKVNVTVPCKSFFNFFKDKDPNKTMGEGDDEQDDEESDMQDQQETADQIKDDLVPLALEYYLGVIEIDDDDDDDDSDDGSGDDKKKDGDDSDGDDKPKKKKKKGKKDQLPEGVDPKDCKQ